MSLKEILASNNKLQGRFKLEIEKNFLTVIREKLENAVWEYYRISIIRGLQEEFKIHLLRMA